MGPNGIYSDLIGLLVRGALLVLLLTMAPAVYAQTVPDAGPAAVAAIDWLAPIIMVAGVMLGGWLIVKLAGLIGLKVNDLQRAVIDHGLQRAIGYAITTVGDQARHGIPIRVKNEALAVAVDYAVRTIPGALKHFGKSRDDIAKMVEARLHTALIASEPQPSGEVREDGRR